MDELDFARALEKLKASTDCRELLGGVRILCAMSQLTSIQNTELEIVVELALVRIQQEERDSLTSALKSLSVFQTEKAVA